MMSELGKYHDLLQRQLIEGLKQQEAELNILWAATDVESILVRQVGEYLYRIEMRDLNETRCVDLIRRPVGFQMRIFQHARQYVGCWNLVEKVRVS